ncbi:MAG TPA: hypothetical protein VFO99_15710, partial [Pyrinomonadaceae bacterium]|nr:hypothetical protein [Pyrinomonadaceae bacterium]
RAFYVARRKEERDDFKSLVLVHSELPNKEQDRKGASKARPRLVTQQRGRCPLPDLFLLGEPFKVNHY